MKLRKWSEILIYAAIYLYGGVITLLLLLRALVGERFLPLMLFDILLPSILFPSMVLLIFCAMLRRWRLALVQLPVLIGFIWLYGHLLLPTNLSPAPLGTQISLLTHNIALGEGELESESALIREADADVVALQEVSEDAAAYFQSALADLYPYQAIHAGDRPPGQAVFSRFPILEDEVWELERMHQRVLLEVDGQQVTIYNVHPIHFYLTLADVVNFEAQSQEVDEIIARTTVEETPTMIVGDFNTTDQSDVYRRFAALYGDTYGEVGSGFGFTFPSIFPLARLDYVFHTSEFTPLTARVWKSSGGSDHDPVYVQLELVRVTAAH